MYTKIAGKLLIKENITTIWERYGKPSNITCRYTGSRDTSITWLKDSLPVIVNDHMTISSQWGIRNASFSEESTIFIDKTNFTHGGRYTCRAGRESQNVQLKVIKGKWPIYMKNG